MFYMLSCMSYIHQKIHKVSEFIYLFMHVYVYVCVCVCVCVCVWIRYSENFHPSACWLPRTFFFRELPPRTFSISTLQVRIGVRNSLAKFGKRPLKTCFIHCLFNPSSENISSVPISTSEILLYSTWLQ